MLPVVLAAGCGLVQAPYASFGLVQDLLKEIASRCVAVLVADLNGGALLLCHVPVILDQFLDHLLGGNEIPILIGDGLQLTNVGDAADGHAADPPYPLRQWVDRFENRGGLFIEEQVEIPVMGTRQMPMEAL